MASTVRNLLTIGALITWLGGAAAAHYILGLEWLLSILFGALIVVTGPTVIAPLLRNVRPNQRIYSVGASLAVLVFNYIVAVVIFVIRPINMQVSAIGSKLTGKERLFLSWIAPRAAPFP